MSFASIKKIASDVGVGYSAMTQDKKIKALDEAGFPIPSKYRYAAMTIAELRALAAARAIEVPVRAKKKELIELLVSGAHSELLERAGGVGTSWERLYNVLLDWGLLDDVVDEGTNLSYEELETLALNSATPQASQITEPEYFKQSVYAAELKEVNPGLYELASRVIAQLPDPRDLLVQTRASPAKKVWDPWREVLQEIDNIFTDPEYERVVDYMQETGDRPSPEEIKQFSELFPVMTYIYGWTSRIFQWLLVSAGAQRPFQMSELIQDRQAKLPNLLRYTKTLRFVHRYDLLPDNIESDTYGDLYRLAFFCSDVVIFDLLVKQRYARDALEGVIPSHRNEAKFADMVKFSEQNSISVDYVLILLSEDLRPEDKRNKSFLQHYMEMDVPRTAGRAAVALRILEMTEPIQIERLIYLFAYGASVKEITDSSFYQDLKSLVQRNPEFSELTFAKVYFFPDLVEIANEPLTSQTSALRIAALLGNRQLVAKILGQSSIKQQLLYHSLSPNTFDVLIEHINLQKFIDDLFVNKRLLERRHNRYQVDKDYKLADMLQALLDAKLPRTPTPKWYRNIFLRYHSEIREVATGFWELHWETIRDLNNFFITLVRYGVRTDRNSLIKIREMLEIIQLKKFTDYLHTEGKVLVILRKCEECNYY